MTPFTAPAAAKVGSPKFETINRIKKMLKELGESVLDDFFSGCKRKYVDELCCAFYFWLSGMDNGFGHSCCLHSSDKKYNRMNIGKRPYFCISGYGIRIRNTLFVVAIANDSTVRDSPYSFTQPVLLRDGLSNT